MKVYFGSVIRSAPVREGGELVCLDWKTKQILSKVPIFPTNPALDHDPNPRGNTRGCRGISVWKDNIVAATYHTIKFFDFNLDHKRDLSHGLMVGLHEMDIRGDNVLLSSTAIDAAVEYNLITGELINKYMPREVSIFQDYFDLVPLEIDCDIDQRRNWLAENTTHPSHLHLNAVAKWGDNDYALLNSFGAIVNLTKPEIVLEDNSLKKGHNLIINSQGLAILNDTSGKTVRFYDLTKRKLIKIIDLNSFYFVRNIAKYQRIKNIFKKVKGKLGTSCGIQVAKPLFVRGLAMDSDHRFLFVGLSPASILCIDWEKRELVDAFNYSSHLVNCIHGLKVI